MAQMGVECQAIIAIGWYRWLEPYVVGHRLCPGGILSFAIVTGMLGVEFVVGTPGAVVPPAVAMVIMDYKSGMIAGFKSQRVIECEQTRIVGIL